MVYNSPSTNEAYRGEAIDAVIRTGTPYFTFYREIEGVTDISINPLSTLLYLTAAANF